MRFPSFLLLFFVCYLGLSQELPPFTNFDSNEYAAGNQNWMLTQSENRNIYAANAMGLLEYTGTEWNLYPMPNNTIVRSVKAVGDKIFTGAYMELGFWTKNKLGRLEYTSLLSKLQEKLHDGEQFWHIEKIGEYVVFQSFENLYLYNLRNKNIRRITLPPDFSISNLFKASSQIFFQVANHGLYTIKHGNPQVFIPNEVLKDRHIIGFFKQGPNFHMIDQTGEFFIWNGNTLEQYNRGFSENIKDANVFSVLKLQDHLILGTVSHGIFYLDQHANLVYHWEQENGLLNNTVLSLFKDKDENIWAGLDNGMSVVNIDAPFKLFTDTKGRIGSVYCSFQNEKYMYLGTNQGLYFRKNTDSEFQLVPGTNGQVWSLQEIEGQLFCGHNNGTFLIKEEKAEKISDRSGTWMIRKLKDTSDYFVQGHYNGLSLLKKENDSFINFPLLKGFPHSSKFIVPKTNGDIWIGNEHKGIFKIRLQLSENKIRDSQNYPFMDVSGIGSSIFEFNDDLYYATKDKVFQYLPQKDAFEQENPLAKVIAPLNRISGKIIRDKNNELWGFAENSVFHIGLNPMSSDFTLESIYIPRKLRNITSGYENIAQLPSGSYMLGMVNGYLLMEDHPKVPENIAIRIDKITFSALDEDPSLVNLGEAATLEYKSNNIFFNFSIPHFKKFEIPVYRYRLLGLSANWSPWSSIPAANFKNLSFGDYEFQVMGKVGDKTSKASLFSFEVKRPWYLSLPLLILYGVTFLTLLFLVHILYKRKHQQMILENEKALRMENLEAEQRIIKLQNEQLEQAMKAKSKELAISTMSLIKKNEFLSSIKKRLKSADSAAVGPVIKTIDKEISEEDNWNFFKEAFSNADKEFFKKVKEQHPNLTSNDLRLCAYLRLNLTSKEIAPLLNISVKSVEIKRYRLRKKMELARKSNLVDYILEI